MIFGSQNLGQETKWSVVLITRSTVCLVLYYNGNGNVKADEQLCLNFWPGYIQMSKRNNTHALSNMSVNQECAVILSRGNIKYQLVL